MQIINKKTTELKAYDKNARTHPKNQIDLLARNIQKFGFTVPVLIDKQDTIIAGHGRILALRQLGIDDVPCVVMENLKEDEIKALRLADNQLSQMSDWEMSVVINELKGLSDEMFDLTGFDRDLIITSDEKDDLIPENVPSVTQIGDIYILGRHRIYCGDSTRPESILKLMGGKKADMSFTSPPYNVGHNLGYEGKKSKYQNSDDNLEEYRKLLVDTTRISIQNAQDSFVNLQILANNKKDIALFLAELADYFKDIFFWKKKNVAPAMAMNVANSQVENIFLFQEEDHGWIEPIVLYGQKNNRRWGNKGFRGTFSNLIETKTASGENKNSKVHNATFPVELVTNFIAKGYTENSTVLDLFLGTGTTLIACEKMKRICYGMDIDPLYIDICVQRWCEYTGVYEIIRNDIPTTWNKK